MALWSLGVRNRYLRMFLERESTTTRPRRGAQASDERSSGRQAIE
jgi:hypothetical protein